MSDQLLMQLVDHIVSRLAQELRLIIREEMKAAGNSSTVKATTAVEYLTRDQVAKNLSISLVTLDSWSRTGKLKGYRVGRKVRFKSNQIDAAFSKIDTGK